MLSRTLDAMFKVKQLFTKNHLLLLHIALLLVHFNSYEVIRLQSLRFQKVIKIIKHRQSKSDEEF